MAKRPDPLRLRAVSDPAEARALAEVVARAGAEACADLGQIAPKAVDAALGQRLERTPATREGLLLLAETAGAAGATGATGATGAAGAAGGAGTPRGLCWVVPFEDPLTGESLPLIVVLWIASDERQRGLGRALVREAGRLLAARGVKTLAARAGHNDDVLISMGERWGFVRRWELMVRD